MKQEQAQIDQIKAAFEKMQTKEDLLHLLNQAKIWVYGPKSIPFELKQLTWYSNPKLAGKTYSEFKIKKKSGASRSIHAPVKGLKSLQKTLSFVLQCVFEPHHAAMGFVREKSIVENARIHEGARYVYNIDLKDFFPSIDQARVWKCLQLKPFNLINNKHRAFSEDIYIKPGNGTFTTIEGETIFYSIGSDRDSITLHNKGDYQQYQNRFISIPNGELPIEERAEVLFIETNHLYADAANYILTLEKKKFEKDSRHNLANMIASICCTEMEVERKNEAGEWEKVKRNVLPQGAPTSPAITNIVCQRLDFILTGVARRFGLKYSRYADDITFSSMHKVYQPDSEFLKELHRIIAEQNFHIKESKTRLQKDGYRKEVTGLLVNEKANVQQRYIKQLRMWLYYWERYGYERASGFFLQQYLADKGHLKNGKPDMANVISGKLDYLKMVKGNEDGAYKGLKGRFERLSKLIEEKAQQSLQVENREINWPINRALKFEEVLYNDKKEGKSLFKEGQIELIVRPINSSEPIKLLMGKYIPEGTSVPYSEVFENSKIKKNESIKKHNPKKVIEWLKLFTLDNSPLKYSTHLWDEKGLYNEYREFVMRCQDEFVKYGFNEMSNYSSNLFWNKIYPFVFQKDLTALQKQGKSAFGWGQHNIKIGWQYPDVLKKWCAEHFDHKGNEAELPFSMQLPIELRPSKPISGKTIISFEDVVNLFKKEIEFRDNDLLIAVKSSIRKELNGYEINETLLDKLKGCSFYTNTEYVIKAVTRIFWMIKSRSESKKVQISCTYSEESKEYDFRIIHFNSFSDKELNHPKLLLKENSGDLFILKTTLQSLCDFSITSRFKDDSNNLINARIEYLYNGVEQNNWEPKIVKINEATEGFAFNLKFPI